MVDTQLTSATEDLTDIVTDLDVVSLITGAAGLGTGLFAAEFAAQTVSGMLSGQSSTVRFIAEILTKGVLAGGTIFLARNVVNSQLLFVILGMAGVGVGISAVLQIIETIADTGARLVQGDLMGGSSDGSTSGSAPSAGDIDISQSFSPDTGGSSAAAAASGGTSTFR